MYYIFKITTTIHSLLLH